jgi:hypothetical protein
MEKKGMEGVEACRCRYRSFFAFLVVIPTLERSEGEEPAFSRFSIMPPRKDRGDPYD